MTIFDNVDYIEIEPALMWVRYEREGRHNHELSQWVSETSDINYKFSCLYNHMTSTYERNLPFYPILFIKTKFTVLECTCIHDNANIISLW